jgi:hypothetical protein
MRAIFSMLILLLAAGVLSAQEPVYTTFKDTRVINTHSTETLGRRKLDVRITHRFGDIAGDRGGFKTFYGLETAADVLIGLEYGISDNFMVGLHRVKGGGQLPDGTTGLNQLMNGVAKLRLIRQSEDDSRPISLALLGVASISTSEAVDNEDVIQNFAVFAHRLAYHGQAIAARKFSDNFSLQASLGYTYRNVVPFEDENGILSAGLATRIQLSRVFGIVLDAAVPISDMRTADNGFYPAIGVGVEIETGGHVFQLNLTNATQIMETGYIPYTTSNWLDGEFRFGFTISRPFNL